MRSNRLQLNADKTEVIWCTSSRRQHQIPSVPFAVGTDVITPVSSVRDLGVYIDSDLSMRTHVSRTVSACFATLRQIRSIRRSVTIPVLQSLVAALTLTRLDYGCSTMAGLPARQLNRLQSVLNAAARLVYSARKTAHVTPLLRELHWLRVPQRIEFRLAVLAYRCLNGTAPQHLADGLLRARAVGFVLRRQCYCTFHGRNTRQSVTGPSPSLLRGSGTVCRRRSRRRRLFFSSEERSRRNCFDDRTATHITEHSNNVTAALQSSWKTISVAMKFVDDDDDDEKYCNNNNQLL